MKTFKALSTLLIGLLATSVWAQKDTTIVMNNGENLTFFYEQNDPTDFKKMVLELFPIATGDPMLETGRGFAVRFTNQFSDKLTGSLEARGQYTQELPKPDRLDNDIAGIYWEFLALGNYNVHTSFGQGTDKVRMNKGNLFYSSLRLPHAVQSRFNVQLGTSYLNRTGGKEVLPGGSIQAATQLSFLSILGGINFERSVNTKVSGAKSQGERLTISNFLLLKRLWNVYTRFGYSVNTTGEYYANTGPDNTFVRIDQNEFAPEVSQFTFRIGANYRQYFYENLSVTAMAETGIYPGLKAETDFRRILPVLRIGIAYDF